MPITLINDDERFTVDYEDNRGNVLCSFTLRRLSNAKRSAFVDQTTRRGKVDNEALGLLTLQHCIISWDGVLGHDGKPAPVNGDTIKELPPKVVEFVANSINDNLDGGITVDPTRTSGSSSGQ